MNHMEVWENEMYQLCSDNEWLAWAKRVEARLGHSLDGEEEDDGYSIDGALQAFERGATVEEYSRAVIQAEISAAIAAEG